MIVEFSRDRFMLLWCPLSCWLATPNVKFWENQADWLLSSRMEPIVWLLPLVLKRILLSALFTDMLVVAPTEVNDICFYKSESFAWQCAILQLTWCQWRFPFETDSEWLTRISGIQKTLVKRRVDSGISFSLVILIPLNFLTETLCVMPTKYHGLLSRPGRDNYCTVKVDKLVQQVWHLTILLGVEPPTIFEWQWFFAKERVILSE